MPDELLQRLRALTEVVMKEIVALDQFQGAKGAWRYMFGGSSITGECVHLPEWAALSELPVIDAILTEFWGSAEYTCHGGGGDFILPGSEYQPLHSVRPLTPPPCHNLSPLASASKLSWLVGCQDMGDASKTEWDDSTDPPRQTDRMALDAPERPDRRYTRSAGFFDPR